MSNRKKKSQSLNAAVVVMDIIFADSSLNVHMFMLLLASYNAVWQSKIFETSEPKYRLDIPCNQVRL